MKRKAAVSAIALCVLIAACLITFRAWTDRGGTAQAPPDLSPVVQPLANGCPAGTTWMRDPTSPIGWGCVANTTPNSLSVRTSGAG